jgi:RNA polymerase sigma-70 factor, ECF subfamily
LQRRPLYSFDSQYIERLIAGAPETERHFVDYFGALLSAKLRSRLRSPTRVEDARQETFVRVVTALKKKGGLTTPESLGAFVNSVCNNVLFEMYRANARVVPLDDTQDEPEPDEPTAERDLMKAEESAKVRDAIARLPQKDRDLIRWLFFEERDKDEVCRELNIDRGYLRVLFHRAKQRFRQQFVDGEDQK